MRSHEPINALAGAHFNLSSLKCPRRSATIVFRATDTYICVLTRANTIDRVYSFLLALLAPIRPMTYRLDAFLAVPPPVHKVKATTCSWLHGDHQFEAGGLA